MELSKAERARGAKGARATGGDAGGFTLAETVIGMLILMIAGLGVASLFSYAVKNNSHTRDRELAMAVAQTRLEWLRQIPFDVTTRGQAYNYPDAGTPAAGGLAATDVDGVEEDTVSAGRTYRVVTIIANDGGVADAASTAKTITVTVTPVGQTVGLGRISLRTRRAAVTVGAN